MSRIFDPRAPFHFDLGSLAAFRMALGALLLYDVLHRLWDFALHYSETGVVPLALVLAEHPPPWLFRGLSVFPADAVALAGMGLLALASLSLMLGLFTRTSTALCWLLWCSLMARNPYVLNFGDRFLRVMLFWSLWLPLGAVASLDSRRSRRAPQSASSVAVAGYALQIVWIYFFSALLKDHPVWLDGRAVGIALHFDQLTSALGRELAASPWLTALLTTGTLLLEGVVVWLVFSPWWTGACRLAAVASVWAFHAGIALTMHLGHFQLVCAIAWLPFLPAWVWRRASGPTARQAPRPRPLDLVPAAALALVLLVNLMSISEAGPRGLRRGLDAAAIAVGLDQTWSMFAPHPSRIDGWFVLAGRRADGSLVDLRSGSGEPSWSKPDDPAGAYPHHRIMSYMVKLHVDRERSQQKDYFAEHLCRDWNARHAGDERIDFVAIDYVQELTRWEGGEDAPIPIKLVRRPCKPGAPPSAPAPPD